MTSTRRLILLFFFSVLVPINLIVFFPSFYHTARGHDHYCYLMETSGTTDLLELVNRSYSYPRTRELNQGDKILFRPLFFTLLAFERWGFGLDFFYWQITGFILHLVVQWQVLRVLNVFSFSPWSFLFVLLNSVWFLPQEMVIRQHLNGYLVFEILALEAFYRLFKYLQHDHSEKQHFTLLLVSLVFACFFYEAGLVINLLCIFILYYHWGKAIQKQSCVDVNSLRRYKFLIWSPVTIYFIADAIDFSTKVKGFSYAMEGLTGSARLNAFSWPGFLDNVSEVVRVGLEGILLPAFTQVDLCGYIIYRGLDMKTYGPAHMLNFILILLCFIFLAILIFTARKRPYLLKQLFSCRLFEPGIAALAFAGLYIILLCLTRLQNSPHYLTFTLHHFYSIYLFALLGFYFLFAHISAKFDHEYHLLRCGVIVILLLSIFLQASASFQLNMKIKEVANPERIYIKRLADFIGKHKNEHDFSFALYKSEQGHLIKFFLGKPRDNKFIEGLLEFFLFKEYINRQTPKYYLVYTHAEGVRFFKQKKDAEEYVRSIIEKRGKWEYWLNRSEIE